jgi:uncharacterized protein YqcC (DUF446 family)
MELPSEPSINAALRFAEYWNDAFPHPQHFGCYTPVAADAIEPYQIPSDMVQIVTRKSDLAVVRSVFDHLRHRAALKKVHGLT